MKILKVKKSQKYFIWPIDFLISGDYYNGIGRKILEKRQLKSQKV